MAKWKSLMATLVLAVAVLASSRAPVAGFPTAPSSGNHQQLTFKIGPGEAQQFQLPAKGVPVHIEVCISHGQGSYGAPSELMYAVVDQSLGVGGPETWIGTSSNGAVVACNSGTTYCSKVASAPFSPSATIIAEIFAGPQLPIAILKVQNQPSGLLAIEEPASSNQATVKDSFVVNLWW